MTDKEKAEEIASKRCHKMFCYRKCNANKNHHCGEWHYNKECALEGIEYGLAEGRKEVIIKIKELLCKKDEDYDKPVLSPKFLSDYLDQIRMD